MRNRLGYALQFICLILFDLIAYYLSLFLATFARTNLVMLFVKDIPTFVFSYEYYLSIWWMPAIFVAVFFFEKLYTSRYPYWEESKAIFKSVSLVVLFIFFAITVRSLYGSVSRLVLLLFWLFANLLTPIIRYWGKRLLNKLGIWKERLLVLGAGDSAVHTVRGLMNEKQLGYEVIGFLDDDDSKTNQVLSVNGKDYKVFGKIKNFTKFINMLNVSSVIIAIPHLSRAELASLTNKVQKYVRSVMVLPDLSGIAQMNTEMYYLFMQKIFLLKINNNLHSLSNKIVKRTFDLIVSILLLPVLLPVIAVITVLIKIDSKGPAFIIQDRMGLDNRDFRCIKFRTMSVNGDSILEDYLKKHPEVDDEWKKFKKIKGFDPRVTKTGKILRKLSLDELPQIFNVLKGEMSLVGPRPYLPREMDEMGDYADVILLTTPGITGLWQISGRNDLDFEERLKLDTWYVENWSLWLDMIILFRTAGIVLQRKGAY